MNTKIGGLIVLTSGSAVASFIYAVFWMHFSIATVHLRAAFLFPLAAAIMHFAHAAGFAWSLVQGKGGRSYSMVPREG